MNVTPTAAESAVNRNDMGKQTLPKRTHSYNPTQHNRATHSNNACRSGTPAGKDVHLPGTCNGHPKKSC